MTEELVAIPKSEYEELLRCKQRLEEIIQERIHQLDSQIAMLKFQQLMPAVNIGRYEEPLEEGFVRLSAEMNTDKERYFVGVDTGEGRDKAGFIEIQNSKPS